MEASSSEYLSMWVGFLLDGGVSAAAVAAPGGIPGVEGDLLTNFRHQQLINDSLQALTKARGAARERIHHEMLLLDLYDALRPLDRITGATDVEDLLGIIFSTFCVGK